MFKINFGATPSEFVTQLRIQEAKMQLKTDKGLAQISLDLGFSHQSHLTQTFRIKTGLTPAQYRGKLNGNSGKSESLIPITRMCIC